jgi:hypothetical protein
LICRTNWGIEYPRLYIQRNRELEATALQGNNPVSQGSRQIMQGEDCADCV